MTYELAEKFLKSAEDLIESEEAQERLLEALDQAEKLLPEDVSVLCRSARLLFRYGVLNSKGRFYLLALDKLKIAEEKNPHFFDQTPMWWQLWGNILFQLGKLLNDPSFFEMALEKYQKGAQVAHGLTPEFFWDWGEAWFFLGQRSGELTDFQQGLAKFSLAQKGGMTSSFFYIDYAGTLCLYGRLIGDPSIIEESLTLLRSVIHAIYRPDKEPSIAYTIAWRKCALAMKMRYLLTHRKEHFEEADTCFREAILATPKNGELWLDWGELFLQAGWLRRELRLVETGLEKLTALKVKECDPIRASYLLGMGLVMFGLFLENLKLLKDGQERIAAALEVAPHHPQLLFASAFAGLGFGLYFSDTDELAKAASQFEKGIQEDATSLEYWHTLFQTYLAWGVKTEEPYLVRRGIFAISRLCELCPFSSLYFNEWGVSLLRLRQLECSKEMAQAYIEEAIVKFRKAAELGEEEDQETLYNWGCALDLLGDLTGDEEDYAKAIDLLTRAYEKKPSEFHVRYHLALAFSHLGELTHNAECLKQAVELLEVVAKVEPEDEGIWCDLGYTLLNLSEVLFDPLHPDEGEKLRHEAEKALIRAAELGSGDACYHLGCLYSLSGYYTASLNYLRKAAETDRLPSREDLENDEWLEGVRKSEAFQDFFTRDKDG